MPKKLLHFLNKLLNTGIVIAILIAMGYSAYALWDNHSIYATAIDTSSEIKKLRPDDLSFVALRKINPDVVAWLTMKGTAIDQPIVQGKDNEEYLNKDFYGEYSLAGTLFLDYRCDPYFKANYELIYGHYMARDLMFGDLEKYLDADFFKKNTSGELIIPGQKQELKVLAALTAKSNDSWFFAPERANKDIKGMLEYVTRHHQNIDQSLLKKIESDPDNYGLLCLSTCSEEAEDDRTIVLTAYQKEELQT